MTRSAEWESPTGCRAARECVKGRPVRRCPARLPPEGLKPCSAADGTGQRPLVRGSSPLVSGGQTRDVCHAMPLSSVQGGQRHCSHIATINERRFHASQGACPPRSRPRQTNGHPSQRRSHQNRHAITPVTIEAEPVMVEAEPVMAEAEPVMAEAEPVMAEATR
jgi:hypothetical protein